MQLLLLIIAAFASLVVSVLGGYFTTRRTIRVEQEKLKIELDKAYLVELYKKRLEAYPLVWEMLADLSAEAVEPLDSKRAVQVAVRLNDWLYSAGGLIADYKTRGALLRVRNGCLRFKGNGVSGDIMRLRDEAMLSTRIDLSLIGLESFDAKLGDSLGKLDLRASQAGITRTP